MWGKWAKLNLTKGWPHVEVPLQQADVEAGTAVLLQTLSLEDTDNQPLQAHRCDFLQSAPRGGLGLAATAWTHLSVSNVTHRHSFPGICTT